MQRQQQCVRVPPSAAAACRRRAPAAPQCSQQPQQAVQGAVQPSRRALLALPAGLAAAAGLGALGAAAPRPAAAFVIPPPGFRYHEDKLDGYSFFYPEDWQPVTVRAGLPVLRRLLLVRCGPHPLLSAHAAPMPPTHPLLLLIFLFCSPAADLGQRRLLPQPFQRGGELLRQRVLPLLLQVRRAARGGGGWPGGAFCISACLLTRPGVPADQPLFSTRPHPPCHLPAPSQVRERG